MDTVAVSSRIESMLDGKFEKLLQDLQREQECNAENLAKKAWLDKPSSFLSKGNEEQHRFQEKTLLELENAVTVLDKALAAAPAVLVLLTHLPRPYRVQHPSLKRVSC